MRFEGAADVLLVGRCAEGPVDALRQGLLSRHRGKADAVNLLVLGRIWNLWKARIAPTLGK